MSRNRGGGRREEGGRLESSIVRETTPSAILPHSDNKLRVLSFLDFQFIANFKWIKVFFFSFLPFFEREFLVEKEVWMLLINRIIGYHVIIIR